MKILKSFWFGGRNTIGIVVIKNDKKEIKSYIGIGGGFNAKKDEKYISEWGSTVTSEYLREIADMIDDMIDNEKR